MPAHAATGVTVTPTVALGAGLGFDACHAPTTEVLRAWSASPYRAVNIYFGGSQRACPSQPNLTPDWVTTVLANGWSLIPTYVDLQAPCNGGTKAKMDPATAATQGAAAGTDAANQLQSLGINSGVAYLDLEPFDTGTDPTCGTTVLQFTDAWTQALHAKNFSSGVYVNANHGAQTFVDTYFTDPNRPDDIWVADWNGSAAAGDAVIGDDWPHHRIHQYHGGTTETYAGVSINVDGDAIDGDVVSTGSITTPTGPPYSYAVSAPGTGLHERPQPSSQLASPATDPDGGSLSIVCQAAGETVDGDLVWDRLSDGNYVSDIYTTTTGRNGFSNAIARCDTTAPTATIKPLSAVTLAPGVTVSWSASDAPNPNGERSGISGTTVRVRWAPWNGSYSGWHTIGTTSASSTSWKVSPGYTYCFDVYSRDLSGNGSGWSSQTCTTRALDDRSLSRATSGWTRKSEMHRYLGTYTEAASSGRTLTRAQAVAARLAVVATTCNSCGWIRVSFAGQTISTFSLRTSTTHYQHVFLLPAFAARSGTVSITTTTRGLVQIDGLAVIRS